MGTEVAASTARATDLVARIVAECPRRVCGNDGERRAQEILADAFAAAGAATSYHAFRWNTHLYAVLALHFGLAVLGSCLSPFFPAAALALHALAALSYWGDSTRRFYLLRRLLPTRASRNLLATLPAAGEPRLRIALVAHADAAYTGLMFDPRVVAHATRSPGFLKRGLLVATLATALLAVLDAALPFLPLLPAVGVLTLPPLIAFLLSAEVIVRNRVVPGANDNLTGCAGAVILAERLRATKPADVEFVFVATGAEEAGTGGAYCLARDCGWPREDTVVLGIDGLSNGELRWFVEAEMGRRPVPEWLERAIRDAAEGDPRFAPVSRYEIPTGSTDALPFRARGYDAVTIGCIDPAIGAPRHYHLPSDTPENLDAAQLEASIDFVERVVGRVTAARAR